MAVLAIALLCTGCVHSKDEVKYAGGDDITGNYDRIAKQFLKAFKRKDIEGFLELTTTPGSEMRTEFESELNDKESNAYREFFGKEKSLHAYIKKMKDYEIIIYPDIPDYEMVNVFEVIYYNKRRVKSLKGLELKELHELGYDNDLFVFFFFQPASGHEPPGHSKNQWYMDFSGHASYFWDARGRNLSDQFPIK